jgi:hypothetical protein
MIYFVNSYDIDRQGLSSTSSKNSEIKNFGSLAVCVSHADP